MASANQDNSFPAHDRSSPILSDNPPESMIGPHSTDNHTHLNHRQLGQYLDDADILTWKRQFANQSLRDQNMMSNSSEDLSQLLEQMPYQFENFGNEYGDMEDDEIHFETTAGYDYDTAIRDRLKKANEEFEHDETPAELKHSQRVSFDTIVKAVDIVQDPLEHSDDNPIVRPTAEPIVEEAPPDRTSTDDDINAHQYTVPLNDTQPKEGPSLLQQLKAIQFHGAPLPNERWGSTRSNPREHQETTEVNESLNSNSHQDKNGDAFDDSSTSRKQMLVSINGAFEFQNQDDYTAKPSKSNENRLNDSSTDDMSSTQSSQAKLDLKPSAGQKNFGDKPRSAEPQRSVLLPSRPKSSDSGRTPGKSTSNSFFPSTTTQPRPKSATTKYRTTIAYLKAPSDVDFTELNRKAAERKRAQLQEEERKKEEAKQKHEDDIKKAKEKFEKWVREKDTERKRLEEEKRMEKEERAALEAKSSKELVELREKKFKEWLERKNREVNLANEFEKLQTTENAGDSSSTLNQSQSQRAFNRWLRRKYEQARQERRQMRLEERRLRRRQRRSIKRFQLQQDLQLAKAFGYS